MKHIILSSVLFFICLYGGTYVMHAIDRKQWYGFPMFITVIIAMVISILYVTSSIIAKLDDKPKKLS